MGGPVGQIAIGPVHDRARHLAHTFEGTRLTDDVFVPITGIGELALIFTSGTLIDHPADRRWEPRAFHAVQDHLCHSELAFDGFTSRLKIKRLSQTPPFGASAGARLRIHPGPRIAERWRMADRF